MFITTPPAPFTFPRTPAGTSTGHTESIVQRIADGAVWLVFRLDGVRS